jgi:ACT domain-containing protein
MTEDSVLTEYLGDTPLIKMIDFLLENRLFDYSKKQIIEETGLAKATFYKYWDRLVEIGIVKTTRSFGKTKLYKINEQNQVVVEIKKLELALIESTAPQTAKHVAAITH